MRPPDAPEEIHGVSASFFSVSRFYGGCTFQGYQYVYDPARDVLVRADVVKRRARETRQAKKETKADAKDRQGNFP
jgi:hypothetical protein